MGDKNSKITNQPVEGGQESGSYISVAHHWKGGSPVDGIQNNLDPRVKVDTSKMPVEVTSVEPAFSRKLGNSVSCGKESNCVEFTNNTVVTQVNMSRSMPPDIQSAVLKGNRSSGPEVSPEQDIDDKNTFTNSLTPVENKTLKSENMQYTLVEQTPVGRPENTLKKEYYTGTSNTAVTPDIMSRSMPPDIQSAVLKGNQSSGPEVSPEQDIDDKNTFTNSLTPVENKTLKSENIVVPYTQVEQAPVGRPENTLKKEFYTGNNIPGKSTQHTDMASKDTDVFPNNIPQPNIPMTPQPNIPMTSHVAEPCTEKDKSDGKKDTVDLEETDTSVVCEESPAELANGLPPTVEDAYQEALFKYVTDLKLSNRKILKKLTEEEQKCKKAYEESEVKMADLEECVSFLEGRVSQREQQIKQFTAIVQVLLQKVSQLSSALQELPGDNGTGYGSSSDSSFGEKEEEEQSDEEISLKEEGELPLRQQKSRSSNGTEAATLSEEDMKYRLPRPLTDNSPVIIHKGQNGYRSKKVKEKNDNRTNSNDMEKPSGRVLRKAALMRSKLSSEETSGGTAASLSQSAGMAASKSTTAKTRNAAIAGADNSTQQSNIPVQRSRTPKPREKKKPFQPRVPVHNEFRNTLASVTDMMKNPDANSHFFGMDLSSWIQMANNEMSSVPFPCPRGRGPDVVLCLDVSQSMEGSPFRTMVDAALQYVDGVENISNSLNIPGNLAVVTFGHTTTVVQHLTNDYEKLRQIIRSLTPSGTSPLTAGLLMSVAGAVGNGGRAVISGYVQEPRIILFTDGRAMSESIVMGEDWREGDNFLVEVSYNMMEIASDMKRRKISLSYIPCGNFYPKYVEQVAGLTGGKRYSLDEIDRAIRQSKNFCLAVKFIPHIKGLTGDHKTDAEVIRVIVNGVCHSDPFVTQQDTDDIIDIILDSGNMEKVVDSDDEEDSDHNIHREINKDMPPLGTRVRRGPDWSWNNQDGNMPGTVISHKRDGWLWVMWDTGHRNQYCYGIGGKFDVIIVDEPRILKTGETIKVGCVVQRGPHWNHGNKDGGPGCVGSVIHVYDNRTALVRWSNKAMIEHKHGKDEKFEISVCDPSEHMARVMEATYEGRFSTSQSKGGMEETRGATGSTDDVTGPEGATGSTEGMREGNKEGSITGLTVEELNRRNRSQPERKSPVPQTSTVTITTDRIEDARRDNHNNPMDDARVESNSTIRPDQGASNVPHKQETGSMEMSMSTSSDSMQDMTSTCASKSEVKMDASATGDAAEIVAVGTWQYKDEYGGWTCYSKENSNKIEKAFSNKRGTTVINDGKHRILLQKKIQVHTVTKAMTPIRRQVK